MGVDPSNLSPGQFGDYSVSYENSTDNVASLRSPNAGENFHSVVARDQSGAEVGSMAWREKRTWGSAKIPGEVGYVHVGEEHRGKGIATSMWNYAQSTGIKPTPKHSPDRTPAGDAWARKVGGKLPRRSNYGQW